MQPLLLTLDEGYLLTAAPPDLEDGIAPLGLPAPFCACTDTTPSMWGHSAWLLPLASGRGSSFQLLLRCRSLALSASTPDLGRGVAPLGRACAPSQPPNVVPSHTGQNGCYPKVYKQ